MAIELDDFSPFLEPEKKEEEKKEEEIEREEASLREEIERLRREYQEKIIKMQREFKEEVEKAREEAFKRGFKEGERKKEEELKEVMKKREEELRRLQMEEIAKLKTSLQKFEEEFKREKEEKLKKVEKALLSHLEELLDYLYLSSENASYVKEVIKELIDEFKGEELLSVEVGRKLKDVLNGEKVKVCEELGECDFRINFSGFSIESNFKEKLKVLREEIEREIKKTSKV